MNTLRRREDSRYLSAFSLYMSISLLRTKALLSQLIRQKVNLRSPPSPRTKVVKMSSVRTTYLLPIVLVLAIAIGLRQYLQNGTNSITDWVPPHDKSGEFKRGQSAFRNFISKEAGAQFPPEKDRYHLYVSYACPWGTLSRSLSPKGWADVTLLGQHIERSSCAS